MVSVFFPPLPKFTHRASAVEMTSDRASAVDGAVDGAAFVAPSPPSPTLRSGCSSGGKGGKGRPFHENRAWELLLVNADKIGAGDSFESVFQRVKSCGRFYMDEWDSLWPRMARDTRFEKGFRLRVEERLKVTDLRIGDLSSAAGAGGALSWWPDVVGTHVHQFLRASDMLRGIGPLRLGGGFISVGAPGGGASGAAAICLSQEQFDILQLFNRDIVLALNELLQYGMHDVKIKKRSEFLKVLLWLDEELRRVGIWQRAENAAAAAGNLVRLLEMDAGMNWLEMIEFVDGSADAIVLMGLPRDDGVFKKSYDRALKGAKAPFEMRCLVGGIQYALLLEAKSAILTGFEDARSVKMGDTVHVTLNRRRARGEFAVVSWMHYKSGYEMVRAMPCSPNGKTVVVKPFEWAAVTLMVAGLDTSLQSHLADFLVSKKRSAGAKLESELGALCDIDAMVLYVRAWVKEKPLVMRYWGVPLPVPVFFNDCDSAAAADAAAEKNHTILAQWTALFRSNCTLGMAFTVKMLEIVLFAANFPLAHAQETLHTLIALALCEMDDPYFDVSHAIVPAFYEFNGGRRQIPNTKRSREELETFLDFASKRLRGQEEADGPMGDLARRARELNSLSRAECGER